ncbi:MAG: hypothetical protein AB2556_22375 [Candidatus Thiodiazotropha sp.]
MRSTGAKAQTYHSFFRWSDQTEWTPERMGQKFIPRVIIWDEVCILEIFLDWLDGRGVSSGDQGQPPPIAGEMLHDWLLQRADYYEEVLADHRAKEPALKALKWEIHLQPDRYPLALDWTDSWKLGSRGT